MATPARLPHDPLTPLDPNGDPSPAAVLHYAVKLVKILRMFENEN
jgi:hypothetical protein